ncbi:MAG: serine/threonine-protein kinase [Gemmatimonadota bacterium]
MDADRWKLLSRVYAESLELQGEARSRYVQEVCADDPDLKAEVERMLAADPDAVDRIASEAHASLSPAWVGTTIGRYRIVREHAKGGMGRVFEAERSDGTFDQRVALKVLHSALASDELIERFRQERQILARLQHPNIATLLDGGITPDGQPWFAMEFVEGVPIDRYADHHRLTVDDRLRLFRNVCRALVYAHASLVVHRDLKPDNILTTADGEVRLLDFGIAKLMVEGDETPADGTNLLALTPAYASPEQVRGEPIGTATDVYSLGVILYELLTGTRPYELSSQVPIEVVRVVCQFDPPRPSTRVLETVSRPEESDDAGHRRGTDARRLHRRLTGDLDVICLKALRKEPERRYATVQEFLDDIDRHLEGRPVRARPATLGYRLRKGVRRNRWAVGGAAAVLLTAASLVTFYTGRVRAERDRAQLEATKATEVADFLQGLFEVVDPEEAQGATITARELLDAGAERIDEGLAGQPEVQATMLRVIGEVYGSIGLSREGVALLERAAALNEELYGRENVDFGQTKISLAATVQDLGELDAAQTHFLEGIAALEAALDPEDPTIGDAIRNYAYWLETDGQYDEAIEAYERGIAQLRAAVEPEDEGLIAALGAYGNLLRQLGERERAEPILREVLGIQRATLGNRHPNTAGTARELAALLRDEGEFEESEALYLEVLDIRREVLGPNHREVANALNSYAILLSEMGDEERALDTYREFIRLIEQIHPEPHPDRAAAYHNFATSLSNARRYEEAVPYFHRSIEMQDVVYRDDHPNRAFPRVGLSTAYRRLGRPAEAEPLLREALSVRRAALPEGHRHVGEALSNLGATLIDLDRHAEAEPFLIEAYDMLLEGQGPEAGRTRDARRRLIRLYEETGREAEAAALSEGMGTP